MSCEIRQLSREEWEGKSFVFRYTTRHYLDIIPASCGFLIEEKTFDAELKKEFTDTLFSDWLSDPILLGAFVEDRLVGIVEGSMENWNKRFRISNLLVMEEGDRRCGIGSCLMEKMAEIARGKGARMVILETQSCNEKAIAFYRKQGFSIIGFDLYSYSNDDPGKHEVRLEMGRKL